MSLGTSGSDTVSEHFRSLRGAVESIVSCPLRQGNWAFLPLQRPDLNMGCLSRRACFWQFSAAVDMPETNIAESFQGPKPLVMRE